MKTIIKFFFLINSIVFYSQGYTGALEINGSQTLTQTNIMRNKFENKKNIIGSVYLDKEYKSATITAKNDDIITLKVRFNTFTHEFEILKNNTILALKHSIVKKVIFDSKVFKPILDENSKPIFAIELARGKLSLFKKFKVIIKKGKIIPGIQTEDPKDRIVIRELYLVNNSSEDLFSLLKLKKKYILSAINNNSEVINFSKKNKLSYTKEEDVIKMFNFYNL